MTPVLQPRLVFILGVHKSGTSLLRSLFDGHDQVFTIPFESHIAHLLNWETRYALRQESSDPSYQRRDFFKRAIQWIEAVNAVEDPYADSQMAGKLDVQVFREVLLEGEKLEGEADLIQHYFYAIQCSVRANRASKRALIVEKSVENLEHAFRLKTLFPNAEFVTLVRNPYANIVTLRKYFMKMSPGYPILDRGFRSIKDGFYYAQKNLHLFSPERLIRYEDILKQPESIMKSLASDLDIEFASSLLRPTSLGLAWGGNSVHDNQFTGISDQALDRWKSEINDLEIALVNQHLPSALKRHGYPLVERPSKVWRPQKREGLKAYIANRVLLKRG